MRHDATVLVQVLLINALPRKMKTNGGRLDTHLTQIDAHFRNLGTECVTNFENDFH